MSPVYAIFGEIKFVHSLAWAHPGDKVNLKLFGSLGIKVQFTLMDFANIDK